MKYASTSDQCAVSSGIDKKYACNATHTLVQAANMSNMLTQSAGQATAMMMGQQAQMNMMQQGTQESMMRGAGQTQVTTGQMQVGMGGLNAALGAYQLYKYMAHNKHSKEIAQGTTGAGLDQVKLDTLGTNANSADFTRADRAGHISSTNTVTKNVLENYNLNKEGAVVASEIDTHNAPGSAQYEKDKADAQASIRAHMDETSSSVRRIGRDAQGEQTNASQVAMSGAVMSLMTAGTQMMQGSAAIAGGNRLISIANSLKNMPKGNAPTISMPTATNLQNSGAIAARMPGSISGNGTDPSPGADAASDQPIEDSPDLGPGFGPNAGPTQVPDGPQAGKFNLGGGGSNAPGGGSGMGGDGGGTGAATGTQDDPQAKLAPNQGGSGYESAGSGGFMPGGGGGGKGADGGPDLSGLLAKFLPQAEDKDKPGNSILDYGSKGPNEKPDGSILGPGGPTLFERAHKTYIDKAAHGLVGG